MSSDDRDASDPRALDYYITEISEKPYREGSQDEVGRLIKRLTKQEWAVGYRDYPFSGGKVEFSHSPDLILLHADIGLVVFTCRGYGIDRIEQVHPEEWLVDGDYDDPLREVEDQLAHIQARISGTPDLMPFWQEASRIAAVALPNISRTEWEAAGYSDFRRPDAQPKRLILFEEDLAHGAFRDSLVEIAGGVDISEELFKKARRRMNQGDTLTSDRTPIDKDELTHTRRDLYKAAVWGFDLHEQDKIQEQIGLHIPPGPQQIRGIAGSGKTTIMTKKAAAMHALRPDWDIAFTFNTRALYQTITDAVQNFYRDFQSGGSPSDNLAIMHAWGQNPSNAGENEQARGLYRTIATSMDIEPYRIQKGTDDFIELNTHAADLINDDKDIPELYDAIFIDEAQDFKPGFYRMCYEALREPKRLIWAYDEAQTLNSLTAPSPKEIFEKDDAEHRSVDMSGMYEGGVRKSFVMRQSYRTPREILMTAHALGMGLYRDQGDIVYTLTTKDDWDSIGYQVDEGCSFNEEGSEIRIKRQRDLSPHPLQSRVNPGELLSYTRHEDRATEAESVASDVVHDIAQEDLDPNDVMVVCLGPDYASGSVTEHLEQHSERAERMVTAINEEAESVLDRSNLARVVKEDDRDRFWKDGMVTVAGTNRAKGNEAASIHVVGAEQIAEEHFRRCQDTQRGAWRDNYLQVRNEILVALTRSEGWCSINAVEQDGNAFLDEIADVCDVVSQPEPEFVFPAPKAKDMSIIDDSVPGRDARQGTLDETTSS